MQYQSGTVWVKRPKSESRPVEILRELEAIEAELPHVWRAQRTLDSELSGLRSERDRRCGEVSDMSTDEDTPEFMTKSADLRKAIKEEYFQKITELKTKINGLESKETTLRDRHEKLRHELVSGYSCLAVEEPQPSIPSRRGI